LQLQTHNSFTNISPLDIVLVKFCDQIDPLLSRKRSE